MKVLFFLVLTFAVTLSSDLMAQDPFGNWKMSVPDQNGVMIPLAVVIAADGTYTIDFGADGTIETKGKHLEDGNKITIRDIEGTDCTEAGVYTFKIEGDTMTMTRVSDSCPGRGGPEGIMTMRRG